MAFLELLHLSKAFDQPAVRDVSLNLRRGHILSLLGPSGCGKTTLLRLIAGLEQPDKGQVRFGGRDITKTPAHLRQFGFMFQEFALFPHMNVLENVAYGLKMQRQSRRDIQMRAGEMLDLVGLSHMTTRNVPDLAGGERQRVALARSLAPKPQLLMLDEPLGSLDRALRERLMLDIRRILNALEMTAIFVTHDQTEALMVADISAVMNEGGIEQIDAPEPLYLNPKSLFVARFLGFTNLIAGTITPAGAVRSKLGLLYPPEISGEERGAVTVILRPEGAHLAESSHLNGHSPMADDNLQITGRITSRLFTGRSYRTAITIDTDTELVFNLPIETPPPHIGEAIYLVVNTDKMVTIRA